VRGTNTYLIGEGHKRLLIDTGEGKALWPPLLASVLSSENAIVSHALITHWHPDHVGGINDVLGLCKDAVIHKHYPTAEQSDIEDGQLFRVEGATLRAFHCPGHTADHMAFILEEEDAIFTGDNVLGHGTTVFEDLVIYLRSLERMCQQFSGRAYPAHGAVIFNGRERIQAYIAHRQQREEEILRALGSPSVRPTLHEGSAEKAAVKPLSSRELVEIIYKDAPPSLHDAAEKGVLQMLRKLSHEGKVIQRDDGRKWEIADKAAL
jgi:endoribonuclease LACTB2